MSTSLASILPASSAGPSSVPHRPEGDVAPRQITEAEVDNYKEQDRFLPLANVGRVMRQTLPESIKLSKEAKERMQECTSEFISFLTSEMSDNCGRQGRKTINGDDLIEALESLDFANYASVLTVYLAKYRTVQYQQEHGRKTKKKKTKDDDAAAAAVPRDAAASDKADTHEDANDRDEDNPSGTATPFNNEFQLQDQPLFTFTQTAADDFLNNQDF